MLSYKTSMSVSPMVKEVHVHFDMVVHENEEREFSYKLRMLLEEYELQEEGNG